MVENPECTSWNGEEESCANEETGEHAGWVHAESWEDVWTFLEDGEEVRDRDGDQVVAIDSQGRQSGEASITYLTGDGDVERTYQAAPNYVLLPEQRHVPVTEDEMAEVMASILGVEKRD